MGTSNVFANTRPILLRLRARAGLLWAAVAVLGWPGAAQAQSPAEFYAGKTVTLIVGLSPGGGYDIYGRAVARFIGNHIPGKPNVIVQNMPGAGSLTAVLHLDASAPKDGTVLVIFNPGIITDAVTNPARAKKKFTDLAWIGSATDSFRMCYFWHKSGITKYEDLKREKTVMIGAAGGTNSASYNDIGILKNLMKTNVQAVVGYPGRSEVHLAMERGELDGECGTADGIPENWIRDKLVNVVCKTAPGNGAGIPDGTPWLGSYLPAKEDIEVLNALTLSNQIGRPFVASQQVPADRLQALRAAFDATMKDPGFLAVVERQKLNLNPATGAEAEKIVNEIYRLPTAIAERARHIIK
ncbi:MAG: TAXI family TRAP transporter solute-binding subunit [Beijerinckiaceae bacterium]|nr:TAXI family TRAP transporter solute-binding subunit [Beijerinckiaceae bacterium]